MREVVFLRNEELKCLPAAPKLLGYVCDGEHLGVVYLLKAISTVRTQLDKDEFNWLRRIKGGLWFARLVKFFHSPTMPFGPFLVHNIDATHILLDEDYIPKLFDFSWMTGGGIFPRESEHETERPQMEKDAESIMTQWNNVSELKYVDLPLVHRSFEADPYFYACDGSQISWLVTECLHSVPDKRPSMEQVVRILEKLQVVHKHADLLEIKPKAPSKYWFDL
ncbi:hypothetical protein BUALT_Bualt03G0194900 [Buddleja alternifolia]|uniref:Protein kinase domain-containing protein n=1 Tax=Buddleja alternifolia TaxID=168488 RepID=A0AAV6Y6G7_9LAMI|nr:hypothetical protein BUALT_Bualt03G0194900 [Buddleja alternifolia]